MTERTATPIPETKPGETLTACLCGLAIQLCEPVTVRGPAAWLHIQTGTETCPAPLIDPVAALAALGAKVSPALSRPGPLTITQYDCVLCPGIACECAGIEFGSDRYFAKLDAIHGRNRGRS